jgi:hypothetical protein
LIIFDKQQHTELAQKTHKIMCLCVCAAGKEKIQRGTNPSLFPRNNNNIIYNNIIIIIIRLLKGRIVGYPTKIVGYPTISKKGGEEA